MIKKNDKNFEIREGHEYMDIISIHTFLSKTYWSEGICFETVKTAIENSLCFGAFNIENKQIGFARLVTDYATFAYLADVYVLEEYRGNGISKALMTKIEEHEIFSKLRRIMLATRDAHGLYKKFGFEKPSESQINLIMQINRPDIYKAQNLKTKT